MARSEGTDAPDLGSDDAAEEKDPDTDDTEGQALTWKVRKPIPEAQEDTEGHSVRPPPDPLGPMTPALAEDEDDAAGHGGTTGTPRPPVD